MITNVNTVLVGKKIATDTSVTIGNVALFDQDGKHITLDNGEADAAAAAGIKIGVIKDSVKINKLENGSVEDMAAFEYSNIILKAGHPRATVTKFVDQKDESIEIDTTNMDAVAGHRYVVRIVYKDINEAPGQFTHSYEVYSHDGTNEEIVKLLVAKINKHKNRRVQAESSDNIKLKLTALKRDDNDGVDSLNTYLPVVMEATFYETIPGALLSNQPKKVDGVTITKTVGEPGKGYWKQVRDMEVAKMGYKGHVFTGAYPEIKQKLMVEEGVQYDCITIECDNPYVSNDNQYIKTNPLTTTLYIKKDDTNFSKFEKLIKAFITGEASASEAA